MDDFCKCCEYRNKPYWSIVSPCVNCIKGKPNLKSNYTTTTTTTNGKTLQINYTDGDTGDVFVTGLTTELPTAEEYHAYFVNYPYSFDKWSEPKYICPECGGGMCRNEMMVLTSNPPQYEYRCNKCNYIEYQLG